MLIKLPDELECQYAAPLMCGGATVWGALTSDGIKPGDRVGIAGIGGIGHMAIQFASTLGCDVVVFSSDAAKRDEAIGLGAKEFHVLQDGMPPTSVKQVQHLLWCASAPPDLIK
jgi:D-arabinose 1-dehydrogenase-like Zn-dependent alcohol dehydrogenase